jgi:hypothetical protein
MKKLILPAIMILMASSVAMAQSNVMVSGAGADGVNVDMDLNTRSGTINPAIGNPPINENSRIQADVDAGSTSVPAKTNPTQKRIDEQRAKNQQRYENLRQGKSTAQ